MDIAIDVAGLAKRFGATRALDGVDLSVPAGTVYGLLGPNGAGKTTLVRILGTLAAPDAGTARVLGRDVVTEAAAVRRLVSLTGQFASVDEDLTGTENLVLAGRLAGLSRAAARARAAGLLGAFGLDEAAARQVRSYSGGMRRRLDLAASVVVARDVLFLDEPTTGLDPLSRSQVWAIIRALVAGGTTVLLTTQYLDEADQLAGRIAVIDHGRVVAEGTSGELKASVGSGILRLRLADPARRPEARRMLTRLLGVGVQAGTDPLALSANIPAGAPGAVTGAGPARPAGERAVSALAELAGAGIIVGALAGSPGRYLQFILPGTLVMAVLLVTMYAGIGLCTDIAKGVSDRFRSLPVWRPAPIAGALLGDVARYLLAASLVILLGVAMGFRPAGGAPGVLAGIGLVLVFALSLSWAWTTLGLVMRTPQAVMSTGTVVLFPLTLASDVFVRPATMPGWLQAFVRVNPVSHLVTAERGLMNGAATTAEVLWVLLASAGLVAVFAPLTARLYSRKQ